MNIKKYFVLGFFTLFLSFSVYAKDGKTCSKRQYEGMNGFETCVYIGKSLSQAYAQAVKENKIDALRKQLPKQNLSYKIEEPYADITYQWLGPKKLRILIGDDMASSRWTLTETSSGTKIVFYDIAP
jgi:hypothetical protein